MNLEKWKQIDFWIDKGFDNVLKKSLSENILKIEKILNPESFEKQEELDKLTKNFCKNLNTIFSEELKKQWIDFNLAIKSV